MLEDRQKDTEVVGMREADQRFLSVQTSRFWQRSDSEDDDEEAATSEEESDDDSSSSDDEGQQAKKGPSRCEIRETGRLSNFITDRLHSLA